MNRYEVVAIFDEFRIDKSIIEAKDEKSARRKFKNQYKKKFRKVVSITKVYPLKLNI